MHFVEHVSGKWVSIILYALLPEGYLRSREMIEEKVENRTIAIGIGMASIFFIVGLAGYFTYYVGQDAIALNTVNDQKSALVNYKSKLEAWLAGNITQLQSQLDSLNATYQDYVLAHFHANSEYDSLQFNYDSLTDYAKQLETWLAGNITQLQSQLDSLQSDYNTLKAPRLIGVLSAEDSRPADDTRYLHVFGSVVNVGTDSAIDALLYLEAFQGRVLTFNTTISLGTINGESFATYVDEKVPYVGSELTTWHIWSRPYGIDWSWLAGT
jgi:hypothetical protein